MIRPLRRAHRTVFTVLLIVIPVVFLIALVRRPRPAVVRQLPAALGGHAIVERTP